MCTLRDPFSSGPSTVIHRSPSKGIAPATQRVTRQGAYSWISSAKGKLASKSSEQLTALTSTSEHLRLQERNTVLEDEVVVLHNQLKELTVSRTAPLDPQITSLTNEPLLSEGSNGPRSRQGSRAPSDQPVQSVEKARRSTRSRRSNSSRKHRPRCKGKSSPANRTRPGGDPSSSSDSSSDSSDQESDIPSCRAKAKSAPKHLRIANFIEKLNDGEQPIGPV
ncbi:hypothetical protein DSL72_008716 [Monilinia vaccinii-corymbosi]|uniref:Uncharacterized protein n=1 Tax=Monilinia vaccinii-corymbosi TaxID=61207 RepID=A0A8A3PQ21_9HELO|nr:hypothetical protein DSL72_008716 [Monilinia vaccinii-corymbosi]